MPIDNVFGIHTKLIKMVGVKIILDISEQFKNTTQKGFNLRMEINEDLLRKYIFHNQVLRIHNEAVAETYLEDAYNDDEELKDDMEHTLKKSQKIREIEEELLKELNK